MPGRSTSSAAFLLAAAVYADHAWAGGWQEVHETSDDVRVEVAADGTATVAHHLRYRIVAGRFQALDVAGIDTRGQLVAEAVVTAEKGGAEIPARVEADPKTPSTVHVFIDEGKGLGRGVYLVDVKYRLDLVTTKMLSRDGAMWKLAWTAPPAPEGHDGARVVFDVPAAPTEPRLAQTSETTTTLATLRRAADRDELELVRAHVPRGEAVTWTARVDPKAFPRVTDPELRPPLSMEVATPSALASNVGRAIAVAGLVSLATLFAWLLREKQRRVREAAEACGAVARPLVPLPWGSSPFVYGVAAAAALAMLLWSSALGGALLVAAAMTLAAHRSPRPIARRRAPGVFRPLSEARALLSPARVPLPSDPLDIATGRARLLLAGIAAVLAGAAMLLRPTVPQVAIATAIVATALLPIFVTGTRAQLPETPAELAARILRPARDALARKVDLSHVVVETLGRVVAGPEERVDEVRIACTPREVIPGLVAIELALARCPSGRGAVPEVLVRYEDGSPAAGRMTSLAGGARIVRGRRPEERVALLAPDEPTSGEAASLLAGLLSSLEERRNEAAARRAFQGKDRRRRRRPLFGALAVVPARPC